jgi:hypothetical protein
MSKQTIFVTQGVDYSSNLRVLNPDGTAINIAGYSFNSAVRQNPFSNRPYDTLTINVTSAANGNLTVSYPAANSANLQYGQYIYILTATNNNVTSTLIQGDLVVSPSPLVTQPALPNVNNQILDDTFYVVFPNQNSFFLSYTPANTSNVTIIYNGVAQTNSNLIYTISGRTLFFFNNANGAFVGDVIKAKEIIPTNE